jgi:small subunit ribosomal protein S17
MAKTFVGTVSSSAADKTIVVTVNSSKTHPLYRKQYTVSKKFMAHDEKNEAQVGDKVSIIETKPLSARKRFALRKIVEKAAIQHIEAEVPAEVAEVVAPVAKEAPAVKAKDDKKATEAKTAKAVSEEKA